MHAEKCLEEFHTIKTTGDRNGLWPRRDFVTQAPEHRRAKHKAVGCGVGVGISAVEEMAPEVQAQEGCGHVEFGVLGKKYGRAEAGRGAEARGQISL